MNYPVNIELQKLETLPDAQIPQERKFPSLDTVRMGLMWEHTLPQVGQRFMVMSGKTWPTFVTSKVVDIEDVEEGKIITTLNSKYKLTWAQNKK